MTRHLFQPARFSLLCRERVDFIIIINPTFDQFGSAPLFLISPKGLMFHFIEPHLTVRKLNSSDGKVEYTTDFLWQNSYFLSSHWILKSPLQFYKNTEFFLIINWLFCYRFFLHFLWLSGKKIGLPKYLSICCDLKTSSCDTCSSIPCFTRMFYHKRQLENPNKS